MIYKIRIILDTEEDIFRDIEIEDDNTLEDFHNAITQAFGFGGAEMASFYTCDEQWNQDEEIALFDLSENGSEIRLMNETSLDDVLCEESPKLIYVYDFFSMWTFFVELADIVENDDGRVFPNLLFSSAELAESPPENELEAEPEVDIGEQVDNYDDMDVDEDWN